MSERREPPSARAQELVRGLLQLGRPEELLAILQGIKREETQQTGKTPFQERYWLDPVGFAHDAIVWRPGQGLTPYQEEILDRITTERRVCVRAPHSAGKTTFMSIAILWFATTRDGFDWKCVTTASNARQLKEFLWPEVRKWSRRLRWNVLGRRAFNERTELMTTELRLRTGAAFAATATDPAGIEGAHAEHLLYIFDESKAIPNDIFDAAEGAFAGSEETEAFALAASTPGEETGRFWEIQLNKDGKYSDWWPRFIAKEEVIAAGRMTREWAEQRAVQWGERSFVYLNRVEGKFAAQGKDGIIPVAWVEAAQERWRERAGEPLVGPVVLGVDVADVEGSDKTVVVVRVGRRVVEVHDWLHQETMATVQRVVELATLWKPERIVVDGIGLGAGVVSRLRELGLPVVAFIASHGEDSTDETGEMGFRNLRAAAWWSLRERLHPQLGEGLELHPHEQLLPDLTAPTWRMPEKKIIVESKDDIRKRLRRKRDGEGGSTDVGDGVVMAYWDGAAGNYEETYLPHTDASLRAAEAAARPPMTAEEEAKRYAEWERRQLWGGLDGDEEDAPPGTEVIRWAEELRNW